MFGLTKREQRWKAEQKAAETIFGFVAEIAKASAEARIAEAKKKVCPKCGHCESEEEE